MHPLSGSPGEDEPTSPERNTDPQESQVDWAAWTIRSLSIGYLSIVCYWLWSDETVRAYLYHMTTRCLQNLARHIGSWGISMEKSYNDLVSTWH